MTAPTPIPSGVDPVDVADTYGWDTVFAIHIADANAAIAAQKTSPCSFRQVDEAEGYTIEGAFGDWSIVPGGDGDLICMALPINDVRVTGPGGPWSVSGVIRTNIRLDLLHDAQVASRRHLKVRTTPIAEGVPVAVVVGSSFPAPDPPFLAVTVVHALMQDWLNANLGDFDHVFSTVDLDRQGASGAFQWMQPTDSAYAYTDLGSVTDGALAILCMTGGRSSAGLIQQVTDQCIPRGQRAAFLISKARVMEQLLLPSIPLSFRNAKPGDFKLSDTDESVVNASEGINFTVTHEGSDYSAKIISLNASISGQVMKFDVTTGTELSPGIRAYTRSISQLDMTLGKAADGGQALEFADAVAPVVTHWTESDPGIEVAEKILAIAAVVAGLVATVVTDGAAIGALAIAIGFASGVMMVTEDAIKMAGEDKAPSIGAAVLDASSAIEWPKTSHFVLTRAELNDSLQLTGAYLSA